VILISFPRQQSLGERASVLRYTCFVSLVVIFYNPHIFIFIFWKLIAVESGKFEVKDTDVPRITEQIGLHGLQQLRTYDYVYGMMYSLYWYVAST